MFQSIRVCLSHSVIPSRWLLSEKVSPVFDFGEGGAEGEEAVPGVDAAHEEVVAAAEMAVVVVGAAEHLPAEDVGGGAEVVGGVGEGGDGHRIAERRRVRQAHGEENGCGECFFSCV